MRSFSLDGTISFVSWCASGSIDRSRIWILSSFIIHIMREMFNLKSPLPKSFALIVEAFSHASQQSASIIPSSHQAFGICCSLSHDRIDHSNTNVTLFLLLCNFERERLLQGSTNPEIDNYANYWLSFRHVGLTIHPITSHNTNS